MIQWLLQTTADISAPPDTWLTATELVKYHGFAVPKRQADWLLGRWTAKRLMQRIEKERTGVVWPLAQLEIGSRPDGSPRLTQPDLPLALSISHSHGRAFCATAVGDPEQPLGADLERVQPRQTQFVTDYLTTSEQQLVAQTPLAQRDTLITLIWSGKEAFLKAIKKGLTVDTRTVSCVPQSWPPDPQRVVDGWQTLMVTTTHAATQTRPWQGWWRMMDGFVLTMVF